MTTVRLASARKPGSAQTFAPPRHHPGFGLGHGRLGIASAFLVAPLNMQGKLTVEPAEAVGVAQPSSGCTLALSLTIARFGGSPHTRHWLPLPLAARMGGAERYEASKHPFTPDRRRCT